jgi:hypothetical protein
MGLTRAEIAKRRSPTSRSAERPRIIERLKREGRIDDA